MYIPKIIIIIDGVRSVSSALAVTLRVLAGGAASHAERVLWRAVLVGEAPALPDLAGAGLRPVLRPRGRRSGLAWGGLGRAGKRLLLQAGLSTRGRGGVRLSAWTDISPCFTHHEIQPCVYFLLDSVFNHSIFLSFVFLD
jgi:hypothetical protein